MDKTTQPKQTKSKTGLLKIFLLIVFFPFTLSYLIWKQKWPIFLRVGGIILLWFMLITLHGSSNSKNEQVTNISQQPTPTSTVAPTPTQTPKSELDDMAGKCYEGNQSACAMWSALVEANREKNPLNATVSHNNVSISITNNETNTWENCMAIIYKDAADIENHGADGYGSGLFTIQPG